MENKVNILDVINALDLEVINFPDDGKDHFVTTPELNRPGLQYAGFFEYFTSERIQIIGKSEYAYFATIDDETRKERLEKLFSYDIPAVIISRDMEVKPGFLRNSRKTRYNSIKIE